MLIALPPLAAEPIFHIKDFAVTNSHINSTLALVVFIVFALFLSIAIKKQYGKNLAPKGLVNFFESLLETMFGYFDQVTGDRKKSMKFLPIVGSLFFFILTANWMGLLPGTGSIARCVDHHTHQYVSYELCLKDPETYHAYPLFRPANTDLNMTASMAVLAVTFSHFLGIAAIGFFKYANKFIKLGDLWSALKSLNPVKLLVAFIEFFVGLIEVVSEVAKMVSLSLRLYGNIFAGEVLLTVLASLIAGYGAFGLPIPFMALELIVGLIQALVFSMLTLVYLNIATQPVHGHAEADHHKIQVEENQVPTV